MYFCAGLQCGTQDPPAWCYRLSNTEPVPLCAHEMLWIREADLTHACNSSTKHTYARSNWHVQFLLSLITVREFYFILYSIIPCLPCMFSMVSFCSEHGRLECVAYLRSDLCVKEVFVSKGPGPSMSAWLYCPDRLNLLCLEFCTCNLFIRLSK